MKSSTKVTLNREITWLSVTLILGVLGSISVEKQVTAGMKASLSAGAVVSQANHQAFASTIVMTQTMHLLAQSTKSAASTSTEQFLDDRSTPVQLLKSYYNAINRKEYVRAYYYWGSPGSSATSQPPAYPQFEAGFSNTEAVQLTTGKVSSEGAAGSLYFQVPVTLVASDTDGSKHTYAGCYTIRQPNPKNFGAPPFVPMHIQSAQIRAVPLRGNTTLLMNSSCH